MIHLVVTVDRVGPAGEGADSKMDLENRESWFNFLIRRLVWAAGFDPAGREGADISQLLHNSEGKSGVVMTSPARVLANRRNAMKSTGPRTKEGKRRSAMNALKHGMTAEIALMPEEDKVKFERRVREWVGDFRPRTDEERFYAERAVYFSWQVQRGFKAQSARIVRRSKTIISEKHRSQEREAIELSRRLLELPESLRPEGSSPAGEPVTKADANGAGGEVAEKGARHPALLVLGLESTEVGCRWLLARWNTLAASLEAGLGWDAPERFQVIRLLRMEPLDLLSAKTIASILQACQVLNPGTGDLVGEYWAELLEAHSGSSSEKLRKWLPEIPPPADAAAAQQELEEIVKLETTRLEALADELDELDKLEIRYAPQEHAFDLSPEGERMRRYETRCNRYVDLFLADLMRRIANNTGGRHVWDIDEDDEDDPTVPGLTAEQPAERRAPAADHRAHLCPTVDRFHTIVAERPGPRQGGQSPTLDRASEQNKPIAGVAAKVGPRTETLSPSSVTPDPQIKDEPQPPPILRIEPIEPVPAPARSERILRAEKASIAPAPHRGKNQPKAWNNSRHARRARRALERANGLREVDQGLDLPGLKGKNLLIPVELS
jgi:hypothetical protein